MHPYLITLPLPKYAKSRLSSFCYGLPGVTWNDEQDLYLSLYPLGILSPAQLEDVRASLKALFFHAITLSFEGITIHQVIKNTAGTVQSTITNTPSLDVLKKDLHTLLRMHNLPNHEQSFTPHVTLGWFEKLNPQKAGDYLTAYADFHPPSIEITECLLLRRHRTPKRVFCELIEEYKAAKD